MTSLGTKVAPVEILPVVKPPAVAPLDFDDDPWVSDLQGGSQDGSCQSTTGFSDHPCAGSQQWYVQLEMLEYRVANPRWEGKMCNSCLLGWRDWAAEEPDAIHVLSVSPIVSG